MKALLRDCAQALVTIVFLLAVWAALSAAGMILLGALVVLGVVGLGVSGFDHMRAKVRL